MISRNVKTIVGEINFVFRSVKEKEVKVLVKHLIKARKVVVCGAGRVGMVTRAFAMRLAHLGLDAYVVGDANVPKIGKKDFLLISSGSGETQTIYDLMVVAKKNGAKLGLVTGNPESRMGRLADCLVQIKAPSKTKPIDNFSSVQPMTTLNEQCLWLFYDALVLDLMRATKQNAEDMKNRHSILE